MLARRGPANCQPVVRGDARQTRARARAERGTGRLPDPGRAARSTDGAEGRRRRAHGRLCLALARYHPRRRGCAHGVDVQPAQFLSSGRSLRRLRPAAHLWMGRLRRGRLDARDRDRLPRNGRTSPPGSRRLAPRRAPVSSARTRTRAPLWGAVGSVRIERARPAWSVDFVCFASNADRWGAAGSCTFLRPSRRCSQSQTLLPIHSNRGSVGRTRTRELFGCSFKSVRHRATAWVIVSGSMHFRTRRSGVARA